jgi:hypothetical protein
MISLCRSNPTVKDEMILRRGKQRGIRFLGSNAKLRHSKLTEACFLPNVKDIHFLQPRRSGLGGQGSGPSIVSDVVAHRMLPGQQPMFVVLRQPLTGRCTLNKLTARKAEVPISLEVPIDARVRSRPAASATSG